MKKQPTSKRTIALIALFAIVVGVPASISAIPTKTSNFDTDVRKRAGNPSASSIHQSAGPAPRVTVGQAQPPGRPDRALSDNPLWEIPLESLSSTRERPVFSPSRRPPPVVASAPPPKEAPPPPKPARVERPQLSLVGTITGDEESFGIFVEQTTKVALRLKVGEDYQGWKLQAVQGREVTLEHDQQTAVLTMPQPGTSTQNQVQPRVEAAPPPRPPEPPQRDQRH